ncbi:MAG: DNA-binding protein WhiA [Ruminococcaceae bacterium]|nr:DNA-binding protein WhiA [Oscillospiraceae bacterium]
MSFCKKVKNEICSAKLERNCCVKAFLNSAFAFFNTVSSDRIKMNIESKEVASYLNELMASYFKEYDDIQFKPLKNHKGYTLDIKDKDTILYIAKKLSLYNKRTNQISGNLNDDFSINPCCQRMATIGAFLVSGSVTNPQRAYHFEISNRKKDNLHKINEILVSMDFFPKIIKRGSEYVLYIKEKEMIADMLNFLNCKETFFEYHDAIILKDKKNQLNRQLNCESANMDKTVNAAVHQIMAIRNLKESGKFDLLSDSLKEIANLRLENPDASLTELAQLSKTPITRSGINHRLKKIIEFEGK